MISVKLQCSRRRRKRKKLWSLKRRWIFRLYERSCLHLSTRAYKFLKSSLGLNKGRWSKLWYPSLFYNL
jgi:hypothetical protein